MERGVWTPSRSRHYEAVWHTTTNQMEQLSAEASRTLRRLVSTDKEGIRSVISTALATVVRDAMACKKHAVVVQALRVQAEIWGVMAPVQLNVQTEYANLSAEELEQRRIALLAQLDKPITEAPIDAVH